MKHILSIICLLFALSSPAQEVENTIFVPADSTNDVQQSGVQQQYDDERIIHFHSDIQIDKEGKVTVTETIKVHALGYRIIKGIFRVLPLTRNLNDKKNKIKYKILSVKKDGAEEPHHKKTENSTLKIYIGDEDVELSPGVYTYEIQYSTTNQIGFFEGYDEFYWNVNGNDWAFHVDSVSAKVSLPEGAHILQNSCYTGAIGNTSSNCQAHEIDSTTLAWSATYLNPREGLTVAVGFNKGVFLPPPPPTFLELYGVTIFLILVFIYVLVNCYSRWKKYGRDPEKPTVYPQFNVPENLSPAALGYLTEERYQRNFVTASLVNLAVKGYIKIEESQQSSFFGLSKTKTFTLHQLKEPDGLLPQEEGNLMAHLFSQSSKKVTIDGNYNRKIGNAVSGFHINLERQVKPLLKQGTNLKQLIVPSLVLAGAYILGLVVSFLIGGEVNNVSLGFFILTFAAVFTAIAMYAVNRQSGQFRLGCGCIFGLIFGGMFAASFIAPIIYWGFTSSMDINFRSTYIFLVVGALFLILFAYLIKRPLDEKVRIQSLIEGFKMYMGAAENEQLKFHNPPEFTPELFEKYLPYAIVLGVDKVWGKRFEKLLQHTSIEYTNEWYSGGSMAPYAFGSYLNSSMTSSISSAATQPSSSSSSSSGSRSSSSSGSSGGGFSGGGGGGGGGGGW